ncbi:MAG: hypothetical protein HC837_08295 [Chloroflexaceae bacterium]|nr:hypothetical protein [Chloroflexaceae bacterium]
MFSIQNTIRQSAIIGSLLILITLLLALLWQPVQAQQHTQMPSLASITTVRNDIAWVFQGQVLRVCQCEWESASRVHGTCQDLATVAEQAMQAGRVIEFVLYDGSAYYRLNDDVLWQRSTDQLLDAVMPLREGLFDMDSAVHMTELEPVTINGVLTSHYQYWSLDPVVNQQSGGQLVYDLFVSAEQLPIQDQLNMRGVIDGLGEGELSIIRAFSDFNEPIVVWLPPADLIEPF